MDRKSLAYIGLIAVAALALLSWTLASGELGALGRDGWEAFFAFGTLALFAQLATIDYTTRQAEATLVFIPLLACAIILPPAATLLIAVAVMTASETLLRRPPAKALFNVAQITVTVALGALAYRWGSGEVSDPGISYSGGFLLIAASFATNLVLCGFALAIFQRQPLRPTFRTMVGPRGSNLLYDVASSPFVFITAALFLVYGYFGMLLVILPLFLLRSTYASRQKLEHALHDLLFALVKAIETRDVYTSGHSRRVQLLAEMIAADIGLSPRKRDRVSTAALLHDVGKIDPELSNLLLKPHDLSPDERKLIQLHAERGAAMLQDLGSIDAAVIAAVRHHHERYDGKGYPDGLSGDAIPIEARIIMLSDSIDAMLSDRPYRRALPLSTVRSELLRCRGSQFDPALVDVILRRNTIQRAADQVGEWRQRQEPRVAAAVS